MSETNQSAKSIGLAYVLWFFLGGFGAHRFYMGKIGSGFGLLGLTVASMILTIFAIGLIGYPIIFIWLLVDAFLIPKWIAAEQSGQDVAGAISQPTSEAA